MGKTKTPAAIETLEDALAALAEKENTNAALLQQVEDLSNENESLKTFNANLQDQVEQLSQAASKAPAAAQAQPVSVANKTFEKDGKTYGFAFPKMVFKKEAITCDMVMADEALQQDLIDANSAMLVVNP